MVVILRVAGVTFRGRQKVLAALEKEGIGKVWLEPEPDNPHDPNAVRVMAAAAGRLFEEPVHVGYVPRQLASQLVGHLDQVRVVRAWIVRREGKRTLGMGVELDTGEVSVRVNDPRVAIVRPWVAIAFRIKGEGVWVMVGRDEASWVFRVNGGTAAVPRAIMRHSDCEAALEAIKAALAGEAATVSRMSEGRELYLKALSEVREVV